MNATLFDYFNTTYGQVVGKLHAFGVASDRIEEFVDSLYREHGLLDGSVRLRVSLCGTDIAFYAITSRGRKQKGRHLPKKAALRPLTKRQREKLGSKQCRDIIGSLVHGPRRGQREQYARLSASGLRFAIHVLGLEDAFQVAFEAVAEKYHKYNPAKASLSTFLTTTAAYAIINLARQLTTEKRGGHSTVAAPQEVLDGVPSREAVQNLRTAAGRRWVTTQSHNREASALDLLELPLEYRELVTIAEA